MAIQKLTGSLRTKTSIQAKSVTLGTISAGDLKGADQAFSINLSADQGTDLLKLLTNNNLSILGSEGISTSIDADNNALTITLVPASTTELGGAQFDPVYFSVDSDGIVSITPGGITAGLQNNAEPVAVANGGTGIASYTKGDMIFASDSDEVIVLPIGGPGESLMVSQDGIPYWSNVYDGGAF